jgi:hypothetical protein
MRSLALSFSIRKGLFLAPEESRLTLSLLLKRLHETIRESPSAPYEQGTFIRSHCLRSVIEGAPPLAFHVRANGTAFIHSAETQKWILHADAIEPFFDNPEGISLSQFVDGNAYEELHYIATRRPEEISFWNAWKCHCFSADHYRHLIYPAVLTLLRDILSPHSRIAEICGGDGELASRIYAAHPSTEDYLLFDQNDKSLDQAAAYLARYPRAQLQKRDLTRRFTLSDPQSYDLLLGVGALTHSVFGSKKEALKVLDNTLPLLKPGGYLVLTGDCPSWIHSDDLLYRGLSLTNTWCPQIGKHFYVARA